MSIKKRVIACMLLVVTVINVPFLNVNANELFSEENNQEKVYMDGVEFNITYYDDYYVINSKDNSVEFEMIYHNDGTADATLEEDGSEDVYQLDINEENGDIKIEVYEEGVLTDKIDGSYDVYEGQVSIAAALAGMTLADWLFSAAVTVVVSKSIYDSVNKSSNVTRGKSQAPSTGTPGSIYEQVDNKGNVMSRTKYGNNRKPEWRQDYTHVHYSKELKKYLKPHQHNYKYNSKGQPIGETVTIVK